MVVVVVAVVAMVIALMKEGVVKDNGRHEQ